MKMRVGIVFAVLALDLGTKWAMYDPALLNQRLGAWPLAVVLPVYALAFCAFAIGLCSRGATGVAFALIMGGYLGQFAQFLATDSVSDWLAVGGYWTNIADIAIVAGAALLLLETARYVARELEPRASVRQH